MEDPELEWEIQKHPSSKKGENTKVRWILNKGLSFGKKVVITCIAISSASLVLPPLVIVSAIGFAFLVPFGLVFASYACIEKLMTKLRPIPKPIPMLEYYTDEDEEGEDEEDDLKRESMMEEEEQEQMEDMKQGVEMRIELDEGDDYRQKEEFDNGYEEGPSITNVDEEGYEEDVGEYLEGDDEPLEGNEVREENEEPLAEMHRVFMLVKGNEENNFNAREVDEIVLEVREVKGDNGKEEKVIELEEEVVRESRGLLEKSGDEVNGDDALEENSFGVNESNGVEIEGDTGKEKKITESEEEEKIVRERTGLLEKFGDEAKENDGLEDNSFGVNESPVKVTELIKVVEEVDCQILVREGSKDEEPLAEMHRDVVVVGGNGEGNDNTREVEELHLVVREVKKESVTEEKVAESVEEGIVKGSTRLLEKIRDEGNAGNNDSFADENVVLKKLIGEMEGKFEEERDVVISGENEKTMEEMKTPLQEEDERLEKVIEKMKEENGEKRDDREETVSEENNKPETKVKQVGEGEVTVPGNENANSAFNIVDLNGTESGINLGGNLDRIVEEQKDVEEDIILRKKKENVIQSNADAREIADECGFDLFDERNAGTDQNTYTDFESLEANGVLKENTAVESVDPLELHTSLRIPEYAKIASETDPKVPSREVLHVGKFIVLLLNAKLIEVFFNEEKIWEQIAAMRAIVGYKATPHPTCVAELKALYKFTGVEPPTSFKDNSDLPEVNDKLRFLMSIVGVK